MSHNAIIVSTYYLFIKIPWPGGSKGSFYLRAKVRTCVVYTTHGRGFILSLLVAEHQSGSCDY